jgi:excisionase family DNA binding protein
MGMSLLDPLLSTQELAAYLDLPVATLYAWRYRGQGPSGFRVGRHIRYRQTDVDQWIMDQLAASSSLSTPSPHVGRGS